MGYESEEGEMNTLAWAAVVGRVNDSMILKVQHRGDGTRGGGGWRGLKATAYETAVGKRSTTNN
jgi:hypothetical protein